MTAWTVGFKIPNLSRRIFGEGAASASLIPVYSEQLHQDPQKAYRLVGTVMSVFFVLLSVIALIGEVIIIFFGGVLAEKTGTRMGLALTGIMLPYMVMVCLTAILGGVLNVHRHFAAPAAAPILLNLVLIGGLFATGSILKIRPETQIYMIAFGVLVAGAAQLAIQIPPLRANGVLLAPAWDIRSEGFKKILLLMGPMILGLTVTQINTLLDDVIALSFMNEKAYPLGYGAPSYLYYAQRMYQLPLGVFGISLATAIFPVMSGEAAKKDFAALRSTVSRGLQAALFIAVPATAGLILVARPAIAVIFEHGRFTPGDTIATARTLSFYTLGLTGFFAQQIVIRIFYSLQNSKVPALTAVIAVVANLGLNLTLIWPLGPGGLAMATSLCSYLQVFILLWVLRRKYGLTFWDGLTPSAIKTFVASAFMVALGLAILLGTKSFLSQGRRMHEIIRLALVVSGSGGMYLVVAWLTKNPMLSLILSRRNRVQTPPIPNTEEPAS